ncbi:P22 phage major capsid protein family protein, partial [Falsiroseomonas sp.]|uniref:P22 phage major capsid protein family protein n=1 Tax=Falsiroseomonas sp. TaxID=2870721 RepID=UPI00271E6DD3
DLEGVLDGAVARGAASIAVDGFADGATVKAGDSFTIAGHAQHYVATADVTLAGGAGIIPIYPEAARAYDSGALLTFETGPGSAAGSFSANLMFHRNFAALVLAPLPATGDGRGAQIETVTDPVTGLSLRARMWYDGDTATNFVALDVLYGLTVLDGNLAVRLRRPLA